MSLVAVDPSSWRLDKLGAASWRMRKQAVDALQVQIRQLRASEGELEVLAERLLVRALEPDGLAARAACAELLVYLGDVAADAVLTRIASTPMPPRALVELLGELADPRALAPCAQVLRERSYDANLRAAAATALGRLGGTEAIASLQAALGDAPTMLAVHILDALVAARADVPLSVLEPRLSEPLTRRVCAQVLAYSEHARADELLRELLVDGLAGVRLAAMNALEVRGERKGLKLFQPLTGAGLAVVRGFLRHRDVRVRRAALSILTWARDPLAVDTVVSGLAGSFAFEQARRYIRAVVDGAGGREAVTRVLGEPADSPNRAEALRLLGTLRPVHVDAAVTQRLTEELQSRDEDVACAAAQALAAVGTLEHLEPLARAMARAGHAGDAAMDAVGAQLRRKRTGAHDYFERVFGDAWMQSGQLACRVCRLAGTLRMPGSAPRLIAALRAPDVDVRVCAATALGMVDEGVNDAESCGALALALADEEARVRVAACRGLRGRVHALDSLLAATLDSVPKVRAAAIRALVPIEHPRARARLRALVEADAAPEVIVAALEGLHTETCEHDRAQVLRLCCAKDPKLAKAAVRSLRGVDAEDVRDAVLNALAHARWDVRRAAVAVLAMHRGHARVRTALREAQARERDPLVLESLRHVLPDGIRGAR